MEFVLIPLVAFVVSGLTMFSGFGLGTLLMPAFALFLPIELAVAATAVVHGANNVLKVALLGRRADRRIVLAFGVPGMIAALLGAWALGALSGLPELHEYSIAGHAAVVTPIKLVVAILLAVFAVLELHPRFEKLKFDRKHLPVGGALSGFFGGLSGQQGALRAAFLAKAGVSAEAFVGTNAVIGLLVDASRLSVYAALVSGGAMSALLGPREGWLVALGTIAAFTGVVVGKRMLRKVTMRSIQRLTGGMLIFVAVLLGSGIV